MGFYILNIVGRMFLVKNIKIQSFPINICEQRHLKTAQPFSNVRALFWSANIRKPFSNGDGHICASPRTKTLFSCELYKTDVQHRKKQMRFSYADYHIY
jgi:hypothetical protein